MFHIIKHVPPVITPMLFQLPEPRGVKSLAEELEHYTSCSQQDWEQVEVLPEALEKALLFSNVSNV